MQGIILSCGPPIGELLGCYCLLPSAYLRWLLIETFYVVLSLPFTAIGGHWRPLTSTAADPCMEWVGVTTSAQPQFIVCWSCLWLFVAVWGCCRLWLVVLVIIAVIPHGRVWLSVIDCIGCLSLLVVVCVLIHAWYISLSIYIYVCIYI